MGAIRLDRWVGGAVKQGPHFALLACRTGIRIRAQCSKTEWLRQIQRACIFYAALVGRRQRFLRLRAEEEELSCKRRQSRSPIKRASTRLAVAAPQAVATARLLPTKLSVSPRISCSARTLVVASRPIAPVRRFTQPRSAECVQQPRGANPLVWLQLADAEILVGAVSSARSVNQACFQLDASASRTAESCLSRQLRQAVPMPLSLEEWHKHSTLQHSRH